MQNDVDMIRDLLRAGQDPNESNEEGVTPLIVACQQGSLSATKLIVKAGGNVNYQDNSGFTPLMETAILGYERIAQFLLEHGADPSIKNNNGETAGELAIREEQHDLAAILNNDPDPSPKKEKLESQENPQPPLKIVSDVSTPPKMPKEDVDDFQDHASHKEHVADLKPPAIPVEPPPLPEDPEKEKPSKSPVRFVDDLAPVVDDEKYAGPGLICKTCRSQIAPEDIWCAHCKAPIIRRYCGGCHELIPDNAAQCPYCSSSKVHRFRYIRHLEQIVGGAAILGVLLFVLGIYNPQDSSSYAKKLAQQRSEQQEEKTIAAEETSKRQIEERREKTESSPTPAVNRVQPQEKNNNEVLQASGSEDSDRIPTVERIENSSQPRAQAEIKPDESGSQAGEPAPVESEEPRVAARMKEQPETRPESESRVERGGTETASRLNAEGFRLMKNGRYAEAIPVLAEAVRSFPPGQKNLTYAYALYNLGRSLRLVGRADLAIPILEERMKFANQRHIVARELEQARSELYGREDFDNVRFQ